LLILNALGIFFISFGSIFLFLGSLGIFRMPDVFNKIQAGTKATTLGFLSIAIGLICIKPEWTLKIVLIALLLLLTNPIGSHTLARASRKLDINMIKGKQVKENK